MAGAAAVGLWIGSRRLGAITILAAQVMATARVYIGAHYPSDVLAGLILGGAVALTTYLLTRRILTRIITATTRTRLRPLVCPPAAQQPQAS